MKTLIVLMFVILIANLAPCQENCLNLPTLVGSYSADLSSYGLTGCIDLTNYTSIDSLYITITGNSYYEGPPGVIWFEFEEPEFYLTSFFQKELNYSGPFVETLGELLRFNDGPGEMYMPYDLSWNRFRNRIYRVHLDLAGGPTPPDYTGPYSRMEVTSVILTIQGTILTPNEATTWSEVKKIYN